MSEDQLNDSSKHHKGNKATMDQPQEEFIADQGVPPTDAAFDEADFCHGHEVRPAKRENALHGHIPSAPA
jgi:hypothetical protein